MLDFETLTTRGAGVWGGVPVGGVVSAGVEGAGGRDGIQKGLVFAVPPAKYAHFWLARTHQHCTVTTIPGTEMIIR